MNSRRNHSRARGFSMLELLIVLAIIMVVSAIAMPNIMTAIANVRLRSAASNVAGLLQRTRMQAVKDNRYYTAASQTMGSGGGQYLVAFMDTNGNGKFDTTEPAVQIPSIVQFASSGNPSTASMNLDFKPQSASVLPSFNARGLPCVVSGSLCNTSAGGAPVGFLYFMEGQQAFKGTGWAAVSVSPAGRVKVWVWSGKSWQ